jgi:hypothetical protein
LTIVDYLAHSKMVAQHNAQEGEEKEENAKKSESDKILFL